MNKEELEIEILKVVREYEREHKDRSVTGVSLHTVMEFGEKREEVMGVSITILVTE